jgi:hypothetical protein
MSVIVSDIWGMKQPPQELKLFSFSTIPSIKAVEDSVHYYFNKIDHLNQPGRRVGPNLIRFGVKHKLFVINDEGIIYCDRLIKVKKQDLFTYNFLRALRDNLRKSLNEINRSIYQNIFKYDKKYDIDLFLGSVEVLKHNNPTHRVDLQLNLTINNNDYYFIIEYFEKNVHKKTDNFVEDEVRLRRICRVNPEVFGTAIYLEENHSKKKFKEFVEKIHQNLYHCLVANNNEMYVVNRLTEITGSREFSEMLYKSYANKSKHVIPIVDLTGFIDWKSDKKRQQNLEEFLEFADKDEWICNNGKYFVNWKGFSTYLITVNNSYVSHKDVKKQIIGFYRDITGELIKIYEDIATMKGCETFWINSS